jgi:hypothetical protein
MFVKARSSELQPVAVSARPRPSNPNLGQFAFTGETVQLHVSNFRSTTYVVASIRHVASYATVRSNTVSDGP